MGVMVSDERFAMHALWITTSSSKHSSVQKDSGTVMVEA